MRRHVAIGDPQAPFRKVLAILDRHGLLDPSGRLRDDVHLVSMGDHFDWGDPFLRKEAAEDGLRLLEWLAAHPAEQVTLLLGNHDLARVCDLAPFTDEAFAEAQREADVIYYGEGESRALEEAFLCRYPFVPSAELVARDYGTYRDAQRQRVAELLRSGRFRLAAEHGGLLLMHAGVTRTDLSLLGIPDGSAVETARALNDFLDTRIAGWSGGALDLSPLHERGDARRGEGVGALYHRPADPVHAPPRERARSSRRRYDPRDLPAGFPQAVGHVRDQKCRDLMPRWHDGRAGRDGPLRSLRVTGPAVTYGAGAWADARLYLLDGGMSHAAVESYELFDLDRRAPLNRR